MRLHCGHEADGGLERVSLASFAGFQSTWKQGTGMLRPMSRGGKFQSVVEVHEQEQTRRGTDIRV